MMNGVFTLGDQKLFPKGGPVEFVEIEVLSHQRRKTDSFRRDCHYRLFRCLLETVDSFGYDAL